MKNHVPLFFNTNTIMIKKISSQRKAGIELYDRFKDRLETAYQLSRKIVSFQSSKREPFYRWFKYKEGFSPALVQYFLSEYTSEPGRILDPFAGAGTTLFAAQQLGWESHGIELLPVGTCAIQTREFLHSLDIEKLRKTANHLWSDLLSLKNYDIYIQHISITKDAYPQETEEQLNKYLTLCSTIRDQSIKNVLEFAVFSILEEISYTRKDGQYLRWDYRSKRNLSGKPFDKGPILSFEKAIGNKIHQIIEDISPAQAKLFTEESEQTDRQFPITVTVGSCLEKLIDYENNYFDFIITSPPYCNRYDYTRTYALELVFLGYDNDQVRDLRQSMLSCTVENKEKISLMKEFYRSNGKQKVFDLIVDVYERSDAMKEINAVLETLNQKKLLNNNGIPRMVKNYFFELCFVIYELYRICKPGAYCVMVNDNVRYGGEEIPVDLILSEFAESFGFTVKKIFVLPRGKGNSSQQMGNYGRTEIRKCVYLWQKEK